MSKFLRITDAEGSTKLLVAIEDIQLIKPHLTGIQVFLKSYSTDIVITNCDINEVYKALVGLTK